MLIKELLKTLSGTNPKQPDLSFEQLNRVISNSNVKVIKISYGYKSSPIIPVEPYSHGEKGFQLVYELINGISLIKVSYGPKLHELLLTKFGDREVIIEDY